MGVGEPRALLDLLARTTSPRLNVRRVLGVVAAPAPVTASTLKPKSDSGALAKSGTGTSENTLATVPDAASTMATRTP